MRHDASDPGDPLARILASAALANVVLYYVVHPDAAPHFRALQRATGVASRSLQHELARLEELGMLRREPDGRRVRYHRVPAHPRWEVLREMVRRFARPRDVLRTALADVPGVEAAFIFGSFARGDMDARSDIDVLAVGAALDDPGPETALAASTLEASVLLGHEVNVTRYTPTRLRARRTGGFLRAVLAAPKDWLIGSSRELNRTVLEGA